MFILARDANRSERVLRAMVRRLPVNSAAMHRVTLGAWTLTWTAAEANQNLHCFPDALLLGKLRPDEAPSDRPEHHQRNVPTELHPLLLGTLVRRAPLVVEPLGITNTYRTPDAISDRQLLLAAFSDLRPSASGVAALTSAGHFAANMTLFDEVQRIPLLHRLDVASGATRQHRQIELPHEDDGAMIERLRAIVPRDAVNCIGLSGGLDSRFVLGIMRSSGANVRLLRFDVGGAAESALAAGVAADVGLELENVGTFDDGELRRPVAQQVLLTDAQIYAGVPQWGMLRPHVGADQLFHTGIFGDSIIKNATKSIWKVPQRRAATWDRAIEVLLLSGVPAEQPTLRSFGRREEQLDALREALAYQRDYIEFETRKQWVNWFHYLNRSVRWGQALISDVSFATNPVFLLGDLDAQLLGMATSFWTNFHHDRLRRLTNVLLPEVQTPYSDNLAVLPRRGSQGAVDKLGYEYVTRFRRRQALLKVTASQAPDYKRHLPNRTPNGWDDLFTVSMADAISEGRVALRRGVLTVAVVLDHLDSVRSELQRPARLRRDR